MKKIIAILTFSALLFSCSDDKEPDNPQGGQLVSLSANTIEFDVVGRPVPGSTGAITVTSSADWKIIGGKEWCTPSAGSGKSGETVTFTASASDLEEMRVAKFFFVCGDSSTELVVTQELTQVVEFDNVEDSYTISSSGARITLVMETNVENVSYTISESWISARDASTARSVNPKWLQFVIEENETMEDRDGYIVLFPGTSSEKRVDIEQLQKDGIVIDQDYYQFGLEAGSINIPVKANVDYTVTIDAVGQGWLSYDGKSAARAVTSELLEFSFPVSAGSRIATVTLKSAGITVTFRIKQQNPNPQYLDIPEGLFRNQLVTLGYILEDNGQFEMTSEGANATSMDFRMKNFGSVKGIEYFTNLETLVVNTNKLSELDVSKNVKLRSLSMNENAITKLDLSSNLALVTLNLQNNGIEELILGDCPLETVNFNKYHYFYDSSQAKYLAPTDMVVSGNNLKTLDITMTSTFASYDNLVSLDVSECPALETLLCSRARNLLETITLKTGQALQEENITRNTNAQIVYK